MIPVFIVRTEDHPGGFVCRDASEVPAILEAEEDLLHGEPERISEIWVTCRLMDEDAVARLPEFEG